VKLITRQVPELGMCEAFPVLPNKYPRRAALLRTPTILQYSVRLLFLSHFFRDMISVYSNNFKLVFIQSRITVSHNKRARLKFCAEYIDVYMPAKNVTALAYGKLNR
jgi:hypothetical protein